MPILVITDIPRLSSLFENMAKDHEWFVVVNDIHRGIEELEKRKPELLIFQNYLAGLSADILYKHLKSRLGHHKTRFGLISSPEKLDPDITSYFEIIIDPTITDENLESIIQNLLNHNGTKVPDEVPQKKIPAISLPEITPQKSTEETVQPIIYNFPQHNGISIISDFSRHLDTNTEEMKYKSPALADNGTEAEANERHHHSSMITDPDLPTPWYRRTGFIIGTITLLLVIFVTILQQRPKQPKTEVKKRPETTVKASVQTVSSTTTNTVPLDSALSKPPLNQGLASHGKGRPKKLPAFIPKEYANPAYSKENQGWEQYLGQTSEYRVFRAKDKTIRAIQIIDRSGSGIQESFYGTILKEITGVAAMRPESSETKEGYEIRRGEAAGLQIIQYRDAQGGRMRGFVMIWP